MWMALRALILKVAVLRFLFGGFGSLAILLPLALVLKTVGLPILGILAVLALPIFLVLAVVGLPILIILLIGGGLLALMLPLLMFGGMILKFVVFVVLPIWVVWKAVSWMVRKAFGKGDGPSSATY